MQASNRQGTPRVAKGQWVGIIGLKQCFPKGLSPCRQRRALVCTRTGQPPWLWPRHPDLPRAGSEPSPREDHPSGATYAAQRRSAGGDHRIVLRRIGDQPVRRRSCSCSVLARATTSSQPRQSHATLPRGDTLLKDRMGIALGSDPQIGSEELCDPASDAETLPSVVIKSAQAGSASKRAGRRRGLNERFLPLVGQGVCHETIH